MRPEPRSDYLPTVDERMQTNRRRWEEMARLHLTTYPDLAEEEAGADSLKPFEGPELGPLDGKRVCHLQCHLASDSFSLARRGATVVGLDFSAEAVTIARQRAEGAGLADRVSFVEADVYDAVELLGSETFDVVYTSWGVLCWLPDIDRWAATVQGLLVPGGFLYLAETHPYARALREPDWPYGGGAAIFDPDQGDYTDDNAVFEHPEAWYWAHGLGEIVTALVRAGLTIDFLHEHPTLPWHLNDGEHLHLRDDGLWAHPTSDLPLSFTLRASRPIGQVDN